MRISNEKTYRVEKFFADESKDWQNYGLLPGEDVRRLLHGYKYDAELEMWFSPKGNVGYTVTEEE